MTGLTLHQVLDCLRLVALGLFSGTFIVVTLTAMTKRSRTTSAPSLRSAKRSIATRARYAIRGLLWLVARPHSKSNTIRIPINHGD